MILTRENGYLLKTAQDLGLAYSTLLRAMYYSDTFIANMGVIEMDHFDLLNVAYTSMSFCLYIDV